MDISLVTVNYHSLEHLLECFASLPAARGALSVEIVVVDNDPSTGAEAVLHERHPDVRVINNSENVGYARGGQPGYRCDDRRVRARAEPRLRVS